MPFLTLLLQERKELTAKPTAQGSPALHKAEAGNPTAHRGAAAQQPSPPITINSLCKGPGLKPSVPAAPCAAPSPEAARVAGRSDTPAPGVPARVLRGDPASPPHRERPRPAARPPTPPRPREAEPSPRATRLNRLKMKPPAVSSPLSAFKL